MTDQKLVDCRGEGCLKLKKTSQNKIENQPNNLSIQQSKESTMER